MKLIPIADVPPSPHKKVYGRSGRIMALMLENPGLAVEVPELSYAAGRKVAETLRKIATKENVETDWSRGKDGTFFFWIVQRSAVQECQGRRLR